MQIQKNCILLEFLNKEHHLVGIYAYMYWKTGILIIVHLKNSAYNLYYTKLLPDSHLFSGWRHGLEEAKIAF